MNEALRTQIANARYPRASAYDPEWVIANQMGPHALWLLESLMEVLSIREGMKVLDLGCGRAMTSIFLAKEYGAQIWATDLWIDAADNQRRIEEAGVADLVTPVHAEAHNLPFEKGFFDAIVSIDAYQYFGTADLFIAYMTRLLQENGRIGIVVPALLEEFGADVPAHLRPFWEWDFCCWHGPDWWRTHWAKSGKVAVEVAELVPHGWQDWARWEAWITPHCEGWMKESSERGILMFEADRGRYIDLARIVARKI